MSKQSKSPAAKSHRARTESTATAKLNSSKVASFPSSYYHNNNNHTRDDESVGLTRKLRRLKRRLLLEAVAGSDGSTAAAAAAVDQSYSYARQASLQSVHQNNNTSSENEEVETNEVELLQD